jgi:hypothetical protein
MTWTKVSLLLGASLLLSSSSAFGQVVISGGGVVIGAEQVRGEPFAVVQETEQI